jgi:hypothetical protein
MAANLSHHQRRTVRVRRDTHVTFKIVSLLNHKDGVSKTTNALKFDQAGFDEGN